MTITVTRQAPGQASCKIRAVMTAARPDSLTHRSKTAVGTVASCRGRPPRERRPHVRAHRP